jgi:hypothetical protein
MSGIIYFTGIAAAIYSFSVPASCKPYRVTLTVSGSMYCRAGQSISLDIQFGNQRRIEALIFQENKGGGFDFKYPNVTLSEDLPGDNASTLFIDLRIAASDVNGPGMELFVALGPGHPPP